MRPRSRTAARLVAVLAAASAAGVLVALPAATAAPPGPAAVQSPRHGVQEAANKAMVRYFYDRLFNAGDLTMVDRFVRPDYIQHNPQAPDGSAALRNLAQALRTAFPSARLDIKRVLASGDLVVVHSNLVLSPGTQGSAVFDIFRVDAGKIAEHWDVVQQVPATTASGNDMFSTVSTPQVSWPDPRSSARVSKAVVMAFFTQLTQARDVTAFDRFVADSYYQHNPLAPNGAAAARQLFAGVVTNPNFAVSVKRVVADGDLVAVHSHYRFADDRGLAVVDLFRVRGGKVVEHWDVVQPVPATSANDNTMF